MQEKFKTMGLENSPNIYLGETRFARCPIIKIVLKDTVNLEALKSAVKMAMKRYLLLNCKIVKNGEYYQFEKNDKEFIVKNIPITEDKPVGKDNNDYPWLVSYYENYFVFTFSHACFDGTGAFEIVKTILYYYAKAQNIEINDTKNIKTLNDDVENLLDEEMELSLENYNDKSVVPFKEKQPLPPSTISSDKIISDDEISTCHRIVIDVDTLIPTLKRYETTPFAILVPLLARSLKDLYEEENPIIQTQTVINCRPIVGSNTLRNFIHLAVIDYISEKMDKMPAERVSTIFRSILDVKINKENLVSAITEHYEGSTRFEQVPLEQRIAFIKQSVAAKMSSAFIFSYTGRVYLPKELEALVENFEISVESSISPLLVEAIGYQNKLTLIITNRLKDTSYINELVKNLKDLSISCTLEEPERLPTCICYL